MTGGMTTDFKALDSQLMIESLGFVEMNFNESEEFIKGLKMETVPQSLFYIFPAPKGNVGSLSCTSQRNNHVSRRRLEQQVGTVYYIQGA